ncbi:MAG: DUF91 domain-containing protein [Candidatus Heimdallarchaeota archaeon]|nr:DUF91 domain-containing protein [Candidatus Heimdallarchaeota archaeon]
MDDVKLWQLDGENAKELNPTKIPKEFDFENWIENSPELIQSDIQIIGRQVNITNMGFIDLLGVDNSNRLVIIELKRDTIKRDVFAQVSTYAIALNLMDDEEFEELIKKLISNSSEEAQERCEILLENSTPGERDIIIILAGMVIDTRINVLIENLAFNFPVEFRIIDFKMYEDDNNNRFIIRNIHERETKPRKIVSTEYRNAKMKETLDRADHSGLRDLFDMCAELAENFDLGMRYWGKSIMISPSKKKNVCMFTLWAEKDKKLIEDGKDARILIIPEALEKYYSFDIDIFKELDILEEQTFYHWEKSRIIKFLKDLEALLLKEID